MFLTAEQVRQILNAVESDTDNTCKARDYCAIFLGYFFGLRVSEAAMLSRDTFRDIAKRMAYIRTLKQSERIQITCKSCSRRLRLALARAGKTFICPRCNAENQVPATRAVYAGPPEKQPPIIEPHVVQFVTDYMRNSMRPDQQWFFEGCTKGVHISANQLGKIFAHYSMQSGLSPTYSWHALRHGRGVMLYESFENLVMVRDMLRQKSTKTAEIYAHISPRKAAEASAVLEGSWTQAANPNRNPR
jgi:integrase